MGIEGRRQGTLELDVAEDLGTSYPSLFRELTAVFRARGLEPEEAGDLAQDSLLRTLIHLKRHGKTQPDLRPLAHTIAKRLYVERGRRARPRFVELPEAEHLADPEPEPVEQLVTLEERRDVRDALRSLAPRHKRVVTLWMSGLRPAEIARELGIKRNAADALLHRARRQLATKLDPSRATLGLFGLAILRLRLGVRRLIDGVASIDPSGSVTQAATGIATIGAVAVLLAISAPVTTHTRVAPNSGGSIAQVGAFASVGRAHKFAAPPRVSSSNDSRTVNEYQLGASRKMKNPTTGEYERLGLDMSYMQDGKLGVVDKVMGTAASTGCSVGVVTCAGTER